MYIEYDSSFHTVRGGLPPPAKILVVTGLWIWIHIQYFCYKHLCHGHLCCSHFCHKLQLSGIPNTILLLIMFRGPQDHPQIDNLLKGLTKLTELT